MAWGWRATRLFFRDYSLSIGQGSCLGAFLDSYKPFGKAINDAFKNTTKYYAPAAQMLPAIAVQAEMSLRTAGPWLVSKGADAVNVGMMAGAVGTTTAALGTIANGAAGAVTNPATLGIAGDLAFGYGVGREAIAAYSGQCHP
jgi:hypothetical protein